MIVVLLVEPGVDVEGRGDKPHQVPVLRKKTRIMEHSCLTVELAVAVGVAVVISGKEEMMKCEHCFLQRFQEKQVKYYFFNVS